MTSTPSLTSVKKKNLWFHIDGAFGSWVKISKTHRRLADGIERADSLAVDLHKWMYMPYGIGCTLVKDRLAHYSTFVCGARATSKKQTKQCARVRRPYRTRAREEIVSQALPFSQLVFTGDLHPCQVDYGYRRSSQPVVEYTRAFSTTPARAQERLQFARTRKLNELNAVGWLF